MIPPIKVPRRGYCFRQTGPGEAEGVLFRTVITNAEEVVAVQEALIPRWSWLGTPQEFWQNFVFIVGPAPSWPGKRN